MCNKTPQLAGICSIAMNDNKVKVNVTFFFLLDRLVNVDNLYFHCSLSVGFITWEIISA